MQCLIVLALATVAAATHAVVPLDTPEVAAAKAAHFAEWNARAAQVGAAPHPWAYGAYYPYHYGAYPYSLPHAPVVTPQGYLADTPEVAAAKVAHFAEHAKAGGVAPYSYPYAAPYAAPYGYPYASPYAYSYPWAAPVVLPSGHLADTPEVAAAKAAHFAEVAKARAQA